LAAVFFDTPTSRAAARTPREAQKQPCSRSIVS
jgi:hypothetical protein